MADSPARDAVWLDVLPSMRGFGEAIAKGAGAEADKQGKGVGKKFGVAMLAGVAAVGGGAALAAKALYGIGETFDEVADTIRTGTGATGEALDGMIESAKRIGTRVPAEFEAIGTVVADLNTRLGLTGPTLETLSAQVLEAGRLFGEEIDINGLSSAFNAFKVEGEDTTAAMDHLFQVSQATGVGINELATNAATAAPAMQALGFSFEDTTALVGNLDKAGLNSSKMMAGMSKALVELAKDGEEPQEAFKRVTGEIQGFLEEGDKASAIDLASQLFGTRNATQFIGALESGALAMDDLSKVAGKTEDTILGVGAETMDFAEQWQIFKNQVLVALEPIAARVFNILGQGMEWINTTGVPYVKALWESFKTGEGSMEGVRSVADRVWSALKRVGEFVTGTIVPAMSGFVDGFSKGEGAGGKFRTILERVWAAAQVAFNWIKTEGLPALQALGDFILNTLWPDIKAAFIDRIWPAMVEVGGAIRDVWEKYAKPALSALWTFIRDILAPFLVDFYENGVKPTFDLIGKVISWTWENVVKPAWQGIADGLVMLRDGFNTAKDRITTAWDSIESGISKGWDAISGVFDKFKAGLSSLRDRFSSVRDGIRDIWSGLTRAIAGPIRAVVQFVNDKFLAPLETALNKIPGVSVSMPRIPVPDMPASATSSASTAGTGRGGRGAVMLAAGGHVPGWSPHDRADNIPAMLTAGEYVLPVAATRSLASRFGPGFLEALRRGLPGFASGGRVGGPRGGALDKGMEWLSEVFTNATGWVKKKFADLFGGIGDSWPAQVAKGAFGDTAGKLGDWIQSKIFGGNGGPMSGGQRVNYGGPYGWAPQGLPWQAIWSLIKMVAPEASMTSNYRPGAITASGIPSLHGQGRAVDIVSGNMRATFLKILPLLRWSQLYYSPMGGMQVGYRDAAVHRMHFDHIHAALADGGLVAPVFDRGGTLAPGLNLVNNQTGGPEPLIRADRPLRLDDWTIDRLVEGFHSGSSAVQTSASRQRVTAAVGGIGR